MAIVAPVAPSTVSPLPTPPSTSSPADFDAKADSFLGALPTNQSQMNALGTNVYQNALKTYNSSNDTTTNATNAANSASSANNSAITASTAASNANNSYSEMQKLYLGSKTSPPTVDNQGEPLQKGVWYTNTTTGQWFWWNGSTWILGVGDLTTVNWDTQVTNKPTTLAGYGITDAVKYLAGRIGNFNTVVDPGCYRIDPSYTNGPAFNVSYSTLFNARAEDTGFQIVANHESNRIAYRAGYGYGGSIISQGWREFVTTGANGVTDLNYINYNASDHLAIRSNNYGTSTLVFYNNATAGMGRIDIGNDGNGSFRFLSSDGAQFATVKGKTFTADTHFQVGATTYGKTSIELSADYPFIDFHFKNSAADYTARIVADTTNSLSFQGGGNWSFQGQITASGNVTAYSDRRLKKDLEVIGGALEKLKKLTGYTFTRTDTGERQTGLIAQDVQQVIPEAVNEVNDTLTVAYGNLVGLLVEGLKELDEKLNKVIAQVS